MGGKTTKSRLSLSGMFLDDVFFWFQKREVKPTSIEDEDEDIDLIMTQAMRKARRYLRKHKIFEFFQFLIAHLLSEAPDNPIQFLIDLLDKCLLYRAGFGNPPLLFEKPHIGT